MAGDVPLETKLGINLFGINRLVIEGIITETQGPYHVFWEQDISIDECIARIYSRAGFRLFLARFRWFLFLLLSACFWTEVNYIAATPIDLVDTSTEYEIKPIKSKQVLALRVIALISNFSLFNGVAGIYNCIYAVTVDQRPNKI